MIFVDRRAGSAELEHLISTYHIPTDLTTLDAGDFQFEGKGPKGACLVAVERKRLRDAINSIRTGRLTGEQLPKLAEYDFAYLFIEGVCRANPTTAILEEGTRGGWTPVRLGTQQFMYSELDKFLTTIELRTPIKVRRTDTAEMTVVSLVNLYHWFTDKEWEKHRAYCGLHTPPPHVALVKPGLVQRVAAQLPGVGWEKSSAASSRFKTISTAFGLTVKGLQAAFLNVFGLDLSHDDCKQILSEMAHYSEKEWREVPGIGKTLAKRIVEAINGES